VAQWRESRTVANWMVLVLMYVLIERRQLIIFHTQILIPTVASWQNTNQYDDWPGHPSLHSLAWHSTNYLRSIIEDNWKTDIIVREVQEQVEDSKEISNPQYSSLVLNTILNAITLNFNISVLWKQSGCWKPVQSGNWSLTQFLATSIQFQAFLEPNIWCTRYGQYG